MSARLVSAAERRCSESLENLAGKGDDKAIRLPQSVRFLGSQEASRPTCCPCYVISVPFSSHVSCWLYPEEPPSSAPAPVPHILSAGPSVMVTGQHLQPFAAMPGTSSQESAPLRGAVTPAWPCSPVLSAGTPALSPHCHLLCLVACLPGRPAVAGSCLKCPVGF